MLSVWILKTLSVALIFSSILVVYQTRILNRFCRLTLTLTCVNRKRKSMGDYEIALVQFIFTFKTDNIYVFTWVDNVSANYKSEN